MEDGVKQILLRNADVVVQAIRKHGITKLRGISSGHRTGSNHFIYFSGLRSIGTEVVIEKTAYDTVGSLFSFQS